MIEELKFKRNDLDKKYNEDIVKIENSLTDETVDVDVGYWGSPPKTDELRLIIATDSARGLQLLRNGQGHCG